MKILVVCQNYYPEQFRITDICEELFARGHEVTVITGLPNYPAGKVFDGYKRGNKRDENINGVNVHRCFTVGRRKGAFFRLLNYYSFAFSSVRYAKKLKTDYDVVFVNQLSPVLMAKAGIAYKKKHGKKMILYCLDLWPESLVAGGIGRDSFIYAHFMRVSRKIYKSADKILVASKFFKDYFTEKFSLKTDYLPQYAEDSYGAENCDKKPDGKIDLMFAGNVGYMQNADVIVKAAKILDGEKDIVWHIVGDGADADRVKGLAKGLDNVIFHGRKPVSEMPKYYSLADAMLVTMRKDPMISATLPGKVQSYMAAGKPIIGAIDGETKRVIEEARCGFCGRAEDAEELARNVKKFIESEEKNEMKARSREYYSEHFEKVRFLEKLEKEFEEAIR